MLSMACIQCITCPGHLLGYWTELAQTSLPLILTKIFTKSKTSEQQLLDEVHPLPKSNYRYLKPSYEKLGL